MDKSKTITAKLGIDVGGTDVKFAVIDNNAIVYRSKIPANKESVDAILNEICDECKKIAKEYPYSSVGVGVPGIVYDGLLTTINLPFKNTPVAKEMEARIGMPVAVDNDANCAALGEVLGGGGKEYRNAVLITLGTGVGGGVIANGEILRGRGCAGELGHIIIQSENGRKCTCGQTGCLEQYASAKALVRQATEAAGEHPDSMLAQLYRENDELNGKLFFDALHKNCPVAEAVFDKYLDWLCVGIKSFQMIFDPEVILLAGGITKQGDNFLKPLKAKLSEGINVKIATLQNDAGVFGAANLSM